jgi:hypothetical protein
VGGGGGNSAADPAHRLTKTAEKPRFLAMPSLQPQAVPG